MISNSEISRRIIDITNISRQTKLYNHKYFQTICNLKPKDNTQNFILFLFYFYIYETEEL